MKFKFTCKICKKTGAAACSRELPFLHCSWYEDYKGLVHGCLYCRACGAIYDTVGPLLGVIKILFGRMPSKIIATYEFSELQKLTRINNPDFPSLRSMNPFILAAMEEDGRLKDDEGQIEEPTVDFLLDCLADNSFIVKREAIIALRRFEDKRAIDPLIEALNDKNWDVRRNAAITLGDIGDNKAIKPLSELIIKERWEHLVRKEAAIALKKLEDRHGH